MNASKCAVMRFSSRTSMLPFSGLSPYMINSQPITFTSTHPDLGVTVDRELRFHPHIHKLAGSIGGLMTNLLSATINRDKDFMMKLYFTHIRPKLEYGSVMWNLGFLGDTRLLERLQRQWTRSIGGLEEVSYGDRLQRLGLFSLEGRLLRNDLILLWKIVNEKCKIPFDCLFQSSLSHSTRGHVLKLQVPHVRLELRRRFFSVRVIRVWNSLSEQTVLSDTLDKFKAGLCIDLGQIQMLYDYH